jgi:hypothetical protein
MHDADMAHACMPGVEAAPKQRSISIPMPEERQHCFLSYRREDAWKCPWVVKQRESRCAVYLCIQQRGVKQQCRWSLVLTGLYSAPDHGRGRTGSRIRTRRNLRLSLTSGLASNPANREIASSSGASEHQDIFFFDFFSIFF